MIALFNGNADAARILLYYELHINNGEMTPEDYLNQAIASAGQDAVQGL